MQVSPFIANLLFCPKPAALFCRSLIDDPQGVQGAGITDERQAIGNDLNEERFIIANMIVCLGMSQQLRFNSALSVQEAEGDQLPRFDIQPGAGVVVTEAGNRPARVTRMSTDFSNLDR